MTEREKDLAEIAASLNGLRAPLNALAVAALAAQLYSQKERRELISEYREIKSAFNDAKAAHDKTYPIGNKDQLVSQLGAEEGEREFERVREAYSVVRAAENVYINFKNEHPLIAAMVSNARSIAQRL